METDKPTEKKRLYIDKTKFNGKWYYIYRGERYFSRGTKKLHRIVWEHYNGRIPDGYHIHHKDSNTRNNDIKNLACIEASEHLSYHSKEYHKKIKKKLRHILTKLEIRQVSGTSQKKAESGTENTLKQLDLETLYMINLSADFAEKNTNLQMLAKNFVAISVNLLKGEKTVQIKLKQSALFAKKNLTQTNTNQQKLVLVNVQEVIGQKIGLNDVYDISVNNTHEYFANGLLVHNCIDAGRYSIMDKMKKKTLDISLA